MTSDTKTKQSGGAAAATSPIGNAAGRPGGAAWTRPRVRVLRVEMTGNHKNSYVLEGTLNLLQSGPPTHS